MATSKKPTKSEKPSKTEPKKKSIVDVKATVQPSMDTANKRPDIEYVEIIGIQGMLKEGQVYTYPKASADVLVSRGYAKFK